MMRKRHHLLLAAGIVIFFIAAVLFFLYSSDSRQQAIILKSFLANFYNAQDHQSYDSMMAGDLEAPNLLYKQKYQNLITGDEYERMVANRIVFDSERTVNEYGCSVSLQESNFRKVNNKESGMNASYEYEITVKLDFNDISSRNEPLTGLLTLTEENGKWIICRFTPYELLFASVERLMTGTNVTISNTGHQEILAENKALKAENDELKLTNRNLQENVTQLKQKEQEALEEINRLKQKEEVIVVGYIGYEQQFRFIEESKEVFWYPTDNAPVVMTVWGNTAAEVLFAGYSNDELWLFVSIPVFDTPSNNKGWIKESDTEEYIEEILNKVDVGIIIRKGTTGYYSKDSNDGIIADEDREGYISRREGGKVYVFFAGGDALWYDEEDVTYPATSYD